MCSAHYFLQRFGNSTVSLTRDTKRLYSGWSRTMESVPLKAKSYYRKMNLHVLSQKGYKTGPEYQSEILEAGRPMRVNQSRLGKGLVALRGRLGTNSRLKLDPWQSKMGQDRGETLVEAESCRSCFYLWSYLVIGSTGRGYFQMLENVLLKNNWKKKVI